MDINKIRSDIEILFQGDIKGISITPEEGEIIYNTIIDYKCSKTLETGLANGVSSYYIMGATHTPHIAIDPFQSIHFNSDGMHNIKKAGFSFHDRLRWMNEPSHTALPKLLDQKFDFIFLDGSHLFDGVFLDFFYADLLLDEMGVIILHDPYLPAVQKVVQWIKTNKTYYKDISQEGVNLKIYVKCPELGKRVWDHYKDF